MKKWGLFLTAALLTLSFSFAAFAGEWKQNEAGWWYDNGDSTYAKNGWNWIDGKCYYFTADGYCLINTTTPDGYTVDGSGAWTIGGVVQTQAAPQAETIITKDTLKVAIPKGYEIIFDEGDTCTLVRDDKEVLLGVYGKNLGIDASVFGSSFDSYTESAMDSAMAKEMPQGYESKEKKQLNSGAWIRYNYNSTIREDLSGTMAAYVRITREPSVSHQMVIFAGNIAGMDMDAMMNSIVR